MGIERLKKSCVTCRINYCLLKTSYSRYSRYNTYLHILRHDIWCLSGIEYHSYPNSVSALIHACILGPFRCRCVWIPFSKPQSQLFLFLYIHVCTSTYLYIHVHIYTYKQHRTNAKTTYLQLTRLGFPLRSSLYEIVVSAKWPSRTMFVISYHRGSFIDKV